MIFFGAAGIREPVRGGVEAGLRLGVGKAEEDSFYTAAENIVRKRLEVEVQAEEDEARARRREVAPVHFKPYCTTSGCPFKRKLFDTRITEAGDPS